jgi:hypothetical protein
MKPRYLIALFFAVVLLMVLAVLSAGCAPGLDGARQALSTAERVQTDTIHALETYDAERQENIVKAATTVEDGKRQLLAYRAKRDAVVNIINDAAAVTAVGETLIPLVQSGVKKQTDLDVWLAELLKVGLSLRQAIADFKGTP